ncbi:hypothetical protein H4W81_002644 [Nonomuraea africana]|uniref:Uncharacterized protein n=1 Tax=Nonomuraea africana TaxID=46171 RepID=A0ABR9KCY4_9ACTN|nr:hypothetical protein [Nonomuraea africana]
MVPLAVATAGARAGAGRRSASKSGARWRPPMRWAVPQQRIEHRTDSFTRYRCHGNFPEIGVAAAVAQ